MTAKRDDYAKIQEMYDVIRETDRQIHALSFSKARFLNPDNDSDDLIAEGILNRVLRVTEEAGQLSDEVAQAYGFESHAVKGVRNRLAHAYGEIDREIIWKILSMISLRYFVCVRGFAMTAV